ncbi:MAG TPA: aminoglycoside 6'-N-acetyltransferase, partial [Burkholderiales bacterium]|nr:aminoglycoside 6'-N-acetyltransferase [Burkholderiales bacterium]
LREALWPGCARDKHLAEMARVVSNRGRHCQLIAYSSSHEAIGFAEASLRSDYVNGTESSPVAFLEGLYVAPLARRKGVAASLVAAVADWARAAGVGELASDAVLENSISHVVHRALGFEETERVVFFRKPLA